MYKEYVRSKQDGEMRASHKLPRQVGQSCSGDDKEHSISVTSKVPNVLSRALETRKPIQHVYGLSDPNKYR